MAIGKAEKAAYNDEIKDIKKEVDEINKKASELLVRKKRKPNLESYYNLEIATYLMNLIDLYLRMNDLSLDMLGIKNENFLNNARKEFYKVLQMLEEIVGDDIERSLRDNDEYLLRIDQLNPKQVLDYMIKVENIFFSLRNKVGEGSKWKWSFVELQARVAVITKNITDFSAVARFRDPRKPYFRERIDLMNMCKEGLAEAAKQYRTKYELSGKARDDLKKSIELLAALRKIHVLFGEDEDATKLKNTIDAAKQALEAEDKAKEKKKKDKDVKK
ncbi:MAG: hypothetical protein CVV44_13325 [Spirochaetae bacterium HGW-Spirochaetae-1]|jgi:hypothetical protein|nr:MAG: hypothetical protein CVV44_13325 [Spirochaetae bacterium HGW-Spirochaetae-1]